MTNRASFERRLLLIGLLAAGVAVGPVSDVVAQAPTAAIVIRVRTPDSVAVSGAAVRTGRNGAYTDFTGTTTLIVPAGTVRIYVSRVGFQPDSLDLTVAAGTRELRTVVLTALTEELEEITVTTTRGERRLDDEPVRVEVLGGGDVAEKTQMRPSDLTRLLTEMVGVRVQASAGALGPTRFRLQGLRGQYTGLLQDGLPLLGGQATGFGILEIAPVDLQQAEVIKGAATSLYGPSAIGGLVNLVSRRPDENAGILELNQTLRGGTDAIWWGSRRIRPDVGYTLTVEGHYQHASDLDGDRWADYPDQKRFAVRPRIFWDAPNGDQVFATAGLLAANRRGGYLLSEPTPEDPLGGFRDYHEALATRRADLGVRGRHNLSGSTALSARFAAVSQSDHQTFDLITERNTRSTVFAEVSASGAVPKVAWVIGTAWQLDRLRALPASRFNFDYRNLGVFGQATVNGGEHLSLAVSGRCDAHSEYGTRCSPRAALALKPTEEVTARVSGAAGFFAPTPFTEETEATGLALIAAAPLEAERARTASVDLSWRRGIVELSGTLARSRIANPTALVAGTGTEPPHLINVGGPTAITSGEVFLVVDAVPVVLTAFYGYLGGTETDPETGRSREVGYTPKHSFGVDLAWEGENTWIALEAFYTGEQAVYDNPYRTRSKAYVNPEVLISQRVRKARFYLNAENLFDFRQTNYERLVLPTPGLAGIRTTTPWGPIEGRVVSLGVLIDF